MYTGWQILRFWADRSRSQVRQETSSVVNRIFGGRSALLISELVQQDDLTDEEIDDLMRILEAHRK